MMENGILALQEGMKNIRNRKYMYKYIKNIKHHLNFYSIYFFKKATNSLKLQNSNIGFVIFVCVCVYKQYHESWRYCMSLAFYMHFTLALSRL